MAAVLAQQLRQILVGMGRLAKNCIWRPARSERAHLTMLVEPGSKDFRLKEAGGLPSGVSQSEVSR